MTYVKTKMERAVEIDSIITLHYFEYMKDFVFRGESHDFWEFLYVDKGIISVCAGEEWMTLNTGDIIFHKPNEFHAMQSIGKNSPNLVAMSFTSHSSSVDFFKNKIFTLEPEERKLISLIISEGKSTFLTPMHVPTIEQVQIKPETPFASQQLITLYLELFLITLIRGHFNHVESGNIARRNSPEMDAAKTTQLEQIIQYMEFHICDQLTVAEICRNFSISRSTLQSLFHAKKNCGSIEYFNNMKIKRAKEIMREGTMNFTEISYFLAYSSLPYFSKQFKKTTGMSPLEYASSVKGISEAIGPKKTEAQS